MALDFDEIIADRLWVGGYVGEADIAQLRHMRVTDIVNLQTDQDMAHCGVSPAELAQACEAAGIASHRIAINDFDREDLARWLSEAADLVAGLLSGAAAKVYLHCTAGVNRSPTVAVAYLIRSFGMPACDAINLLTSRRDCDPALDVLQGYEAALRVARGGGSAIRTERR